MFESLASMLKRGSAAQGAGVKTAPSQAGAEGDDAELAFGELAMTDELREALFPKASKMVSTIFDRPLDSSVRTASSQRSNSSGGAGRDCLFL